VAKIVWTEEAVRWMKEILDYIAVENPDAAHKVVAGIYDRVQVLQEFPEIGSIYRRDSAGTIRILLYGHYRIAYFVKSVSAVEILGIFHGAMNIDRLLP